MEPANPNAMTMSIIELVAEENFRSYQVTLDYHAIHVIVTHNPDIVRSWVSLMEFFMIHGAMHHSVVGVWVEWERIENNLQQGQQAHPKPHILQLCASELCLIYQIGHANGNIPRELLDFLGNDQITFVGLEIQRIAGILDFGARTVDLNDLCANIRTRNGTYRLRELMIAVVGRDYYRPVAIQRSRWGDLVLNQDQVMFACADAYICFLFGVHFEAWNFQIAPTD